MDISFGTFRVDSSVCGHSSAFSAQAVSFGIFRFDLPFGILRCELSVLHILVGILRLGTFSVGSFVWMALHCLYFDDSL